MSATFPCPNCAKPVPDEADVCPHCNYSFGPSVAPPPPPEPTVPEIKEDESADPDDAWGGRMNDVVETAPYDPELERDKSDGDGPDWGELDRFVGFDGDKEEKVAVIRDALPATLTRRVIAWLIDLFIMELPVLIFVYLMYLGLLESALDLSRADVAVVGGLTALVWYLLFYVPYSYRYLMRQGQSLGKYVAGIEVVRQDGAYINASGQALGRAAAGLFAPLLIVTALVDMQNRGGHDLIAKTRVVRV